MARRQHTIGHMSRERESEDLLQSMGLCSVVTAVVAGGAMVVGSVASSNAANKASKRSAAAQDNATAAAAEASAEANQLSRDQFDWNKTIYERDTAPLQKRDQELKEKVAADAMARAAKQETLADEQKAYYDETFKPIEKKVAADAMEYDGEANVNRRSGMAGANVNQQFSNARGQSARLAGRYGMASTAFSGPAGASERAQALGAAGAATGAAFDTMDKGIQLRAGAANFGRNMPNTALSAFAGANNSGANASNAMTGALGNQISSLTGMNNSYSGRINAVSNAGGMMADAYSNQAKAFNNQAGFYNQQASQFAQAAGGLFQQAGGAEGINSIFR